MFSTQYLDFGIGDNNFKLNKLYIFIFDKKDEKMNWLIYPQLVYPTKSKIFYITGFFFRVLSIFSFNNKINISFS